MDYKSAVKFSVLDNDDALTQVLVRDPATNTLKYRAASTIGSGTAIDTTFGTLTYANPTTTWAYSEATPNKVLTVTGDTAISLTGTANGNMGVLKLVRTTGSEVVTFPGILYGRLQKTAGSIDLIYFINDGGSIRWFVEMANRFVINVVNATVTNSTTTAAKITELDEALTPGTYKFEYYIVYQSSATTTGVKFSVNFTGTQSGFVANMRYVDNAATASTGAANQNQNASTAAVMGSYSVRLATNTASMGPTLSVDAANANMLMIIEGTMIVSASGNIELYHASETAAATSVRLGSSLIVTKMG